MSQGNVGNVWGLAEIGDGIVWYGKRTRASVVGPGMSSIADADLRDYLYLTLRSRVSAVVYGGGNVMAAVYDLAVLSRDEGSADTLGGRGFENRIAPG